MLYYSAPTWRVWEIVPGTIFPKMFLRGVVGKLEMEQLCICICMAMYAQMFQESCFVDVIGAGAFFFVLGNRSSSTPEQFPQLEQFLNFFRTDVPETQFGIVLEIVPELGFSQFPKPSNKEFQRS